MTDTAKAMRLALLEATDPVAFAVNKLGWTPDPWQGNFLRSEAPEISVCCSRQSGKSTTAAVKALHKARFKPESLSLIISPTQRQSG